MFDLYIATSRSPIVVWCHTIMGDWNRIGSILIPTEPKIKLVLYKKLFIARGGRVMRFILGPGFIILFFWDRIQFYHNIIFSNSAIAAELTP